jgi:hypothetical protein
MKSKKDNYTYFNEEWNIPDWEDGVDQIDTRKNNTKPTED